MVDFSKIKLGFIAVAEIIINPSIVDYCKYDKVISTLAIFGFLILFLGLSVSLMQDKIGKSASIGLGLMLWLGAGSIISSKPAIITVTLGYLAAILKIIDGALLGFNLICFPIFGLFIAALALISYVGYVLISANAQEILEALKIVIIIFSLKAAFQSISRLGEFPFDIPAVCFGMAILICAPGLVDFGESECLIEGFGNLRTIAIFFLSKSFAFGLGIGILSGLFRSI